MADLRFYLNNVGGYEPRDVENLTIEVSFQNNSQDAIIKTATLEWDGQAAALLNQWKQQGLSGGLGITEGMPLRIESCDPSVIVFNGCIDFSGEDITFQCDIVKTKVKETQRIQFLSDRAASFSFAYLASLGLITKSDYIAVPYVVSTIPEYLQVALLVISFLEMMKIIRDAIQEITDLVGAIIAGGIGLKIWYSVLLIIYIAYAIFMIGLLLSVIIMLINNIIQPIKYKYGMRVKDLFVKACNYLGLNFSSTILNSAPYNNLVIIPKKQSYSYVNQYSDSDLVSIFGSTIKRKYYDDTKNPQSFGYYEGTFEQLINDISDYFNCKDPVSGQTGIVIKNGTLYVERWDYWNNQSPFTLPPQSSDAPFDDPYGTNLSALTANYLIQYQQDSQDTNTYDRYDGTTCQMTLAQIKTGDIKNYLLTGIETKSLNFALAKRKESLTVPEQVVNAMLSTLGPFFSTLTKLFKGKSAGSWVNSLNDPRKGCMLLSSDFIGVQKILVCAIRGNIGYIDANNSHNTIDPPNDHLGYTDAYYLAKNFHSASWAVDTLNNNHNQYLVFKDKEIPLCCSDFAKLNLNNVIKTYDQKMGRVDTINWNPHKETATLNYRVKEKITNNLTQTIIIDGAV